MEIGIREAKNKLSKLVEAALNGEEIFLTNRGARVAQLVAAHHRRASLRGRGSLKGRINLYPGWDSPDEDLKIEQMFEALHKAESL
ncbi:MAG: type II toxin-antitoxin system prevent-host-death family antitoxin [Acidobacteriaceae bacterium]|nr:type II toxin-antitoxin system prevent-host-death family antitoxin [Acidobacteriaceae bacterium]MBV9499186.1 type II toxin-antitoxin system prevent-host-death family antitoxin [Acidobacteriaceae bacterium]